MKTFVERNCSIELGGRQYTSGGAWLAHDKNGKVRGIVYIVRENGKNGHGIAQVVTWHGEVIAQCQYTDYRGNFCNMRRISFTLEGKTLVGDYCPDWSEACKVRSTK